MQLNTSKQFEFTGKAKTWSLIAIAIGIISVAIGFATGYVDRTWANLLICAYYFTCVSFAGMMFIAVQYVSQAGWAASILRVPSAFITVIPYAAGILFVLIAAGLYSHNLYHLWNVVGITDPNSPNFDPIIAGKSGYLNITFFLIRLALYMIIWGSMALYIRKFSFREDLEGGLDYYSKSIKVSAIFCVVFGFTYPLFSFDMMLSVDAHWFSTMFGWYNLAGLWVSGLSVIALTVILLKENDYMPWVNKSHIHNLGLFMFAFSIFWTYLWTAQFLLDWYANIPEETMYFLKRWTPEYKFWFWFNIVINFLTPFLLLMTSDNKRNMKIVKIAAIIIILGHWLDYYLMVMPGSVKVGERGFNHIEIGTFIGFAGLFTFLMLKGLSKAPLLQKNHPYLEESLHHSINNI